MASGPLGGLRHRVAFTTVEEGNLALHVGDDPAQVRRRRRALEAALASADARAASPRLEARPPIQFMNQVHSADVVHVSAETDEAPTADAIVTCDPTLPLAVMVADCLPVIIVGTAGTGSEHDDGRHGIRPVVRAAVHAGRRGLLSGILVATATRMRELVPGAELRAWIGPAICGRCYEVPVDMVRESELLMPGIAAQTSWGTPALDLPGAAARQLRAAGVEVESCGVCTLEDERFYSYRRDPATGRFAGLSWVEAPGRGTP